MEAPIPAFMNSSIRMDSFPTIPVCPTLPVAVIPLAMAGVGKLIRPVQPSTRVEPVIHRESATR